MTFDDYQPRRSSLRTRVTFFLIVLGLHLILFILLALQRSAGFPPHVASMEIQLFDFGGGGGFPAASDAAETPTASPPTSVHRAPDPQPHPDSFQTPFEAIPQIEPPLVISPPAATEATQSVVAAGQAGPGSGGGAGTGHGPGVGSGTGPGVGSRSGAVLIQGPRGAIIDQNVAAADVVGVFDRYAILNCRIALDQRLQGCRVRQQHPPGQEARREALQRASEFRFRPPMRNGRMVSTHRVTIAIALPPEGQAQTPTNR